MPLHRTVQLIDLLLGFVALSDSFHFVLVLSSSSLSLLIFFDTTHVR